MNKEAATVAAATEVPSAASRRAHRRRTGSLSRRMIVVAAIWIIALLLIGGFALDRVLSRSVVDSFDNQLVYILNSMIASSEIGPDGEVRFNRPPADQRFVKPYSGLYFQISGRAGKHAGRARSLCYPSRSLWDRRLRVSTDHFDVKPHLYDSDEFSTAGHDEPLRDRRARRHPSGIVGPLALPGRPIARGDRRADPAVALDPVLELHRARRRPADPRRAADRLWPVAAAARSARGGRDPIGREDPRSASDFPPRSAR